MINISGLVELEAKLGGFIEEVEKVVEKELADAALDLGSKSSEAAPMESGDLRGELADPQEQDPLFWKVGASLPYTRRQHEGTWFNFKEGGGAKFLETPFRENGQKYIDEIEKAVKEVLK